MQPSFCLTSFFPQTDATLLFFIILLFRKEAPPPQEAKQDKVAQVQEILRKFHLEEEQHKAGLITSCMYNIDNT